MPLPPELQEIAEETTVIGDAELFFSQYVASGQAARDYDERLAKRLKELDELV